MIERIPKKMKNAFGLSCYLPLQFVEGIFINCQEKVTESRGNVLMNQFRLFITGFFF